MEKPEAWGPRVDLEALLASCPSCEDMSRRSWSQVLPAAPAGKPQTLPDAVTAEKGLRRWVPKLLSPSHGHLGPG